MTTDLDEMKQAWARQDRKLDESLRMNSQLLTETVLNKTHTAMQRMALWLRIEGFVWFAIVVWLGSFIYAHIGVRLLAVAAIALDVYAIGMLAATVRQIVAASQINYAEPISGIQRQLEKLRILRIRITLGALLGGTVVWAPAMIVACQAFLGLSVNNNAWLVANVLFGLALIPLGLWLSKKFGDRLDGSPIIQRVMNDISGHNLNAAFSSLAKLAAFETE